ncbi:serpin family protein [Nocardia sp. NPDC050712]|uniref:serpin family protein n=1 Tax=Nocardia sp. NPDC050712 TaxID=3155518 RepID=UPI0033F3E964
MCAAPAPNVLASNRLTAAWCRSAAPGDFVLSGVGLWPLLAVLADAAAGPARAELEGAIGIPVAVAREAALDILAVLEDSASTSAALGVWADVDLPLKPEWVRGLPDGVVERLAGQQALDSWASKHTRGMIERFPLRVTPETVLVLATALCAETSWREQFQPHSLAPAAGPWKGHRGLALQRYSSDTRAASILDDAAPVTRVVVEGDNDLDVHLLLGDAEPDVVLGTGLRALNGETPIRTDLPPGTVAPGLTVTEQRNIVPLDDLRIVVPPFDIRSSHDLLARPDRFGLTAATNPDLDNLPAISAIPLFLSEGRQDVVAQFSAKGFKAAAVTAFGARAAGMPPPATHTTRLVNVGFDRPFGFLAVHRPTGLAVVAGWVASPPAPEPADDTEYPPGAPRPVRSPLL